MAPKIPLVDLKANYNSIKDEVDVAIRRVLENTSFILGTEVEGFERAFADYTGAEECVGVASGTSALHLSLVACGVRPGDEVITTAHTFIATAEAIVHAGATPVFVDIDPETYTIDPALVEAAITPRTRAIVPVHLYGHPADMRSLSDIALRHGLRIVEDAAQAHGAVANGSRCGSIGDLACFSFYPGKNLGGFGDGGAVTGNDSRLISLVRKLRDHGRTSKYVHEMVGYGERLDALQAAVLATKLPHLERWTEARRSHADGYRKLLHNVPVGLPKERDWARHVYHLYVLRAPRRDELLEHLSRGGIGAGIHYPVPLHKQPAFQATHSGMQLPQTEAAAAEIVSLPIYPEMSSDQVERVATAVKEFYT